MTATSPSGPDPLGALPLLMEAGVSVYWQPLEGRTAWVADPGSRQVWLSRAIPRDAVLHYLIEALQVIDEAGSRSPAPGPHLVHSATDVEPATDREPPALRAVPDP